MSNKRLELYKERLDLTNWVIHFIHDRNPAVDPCSDYYGPPDIPIGFGEKGEEIHYQFEELEYHYYDIEPDARALSVMKKILADGYLRAGWSFRDERASIYGPYPVVCFTEMPISELIKYVSKRDNKSLVNSYGIAFLRSELFTAGGRQAIYGLSGKYKEAEQEDSYYGLGLRTLAQSCELGLSEQYRYITTDYDRRIAIDWTHEREWRWPLKYNDDEIERDPLSKKLFLNKSPGLPIWLENDSLNFSKVILIVQTSEEADDLVDKLKEFYDSGSSFWGLDLCKSTLLNTHVLAVEEITPELASKNIIRIDDIPLKEMRAINPPQVSKETKSLVGKAITKANKAAIKAAEKKKETAPKTEDGHIKDVFGFADIITFDAHTEITEALLQLDYAHSVAGLGYSIHAVKKGVKTNGVLCVEEAAANAAVEVLTEILKQEFRVWVTWD